MNEELTTFIIKELRKRRGRKQVIRRVSEREGLNWREAERLLTLVEARHKQSITPDQSPRLFFLSIGALLLGIGLLALNVQILPAFYRQDLVGQFLSLQSNAYRMLSARHLNRYF